MTKSIASTVLALIATFAAIAPVAAATDRRSDMSPSTNFTQETRNLFDIEYWGLKSSPRTDTKIVASSGSGSI